MASKKKVDESLIKYFSKVKGMEINPKIGWEDFWNTVVESTIFDERCSYYGTESKCFFTIADSEQTYTKLEYDFSEIHNSDDPADIKWNIVFHDALHYIKANKLIKKESKRKKK